MKKPVYSPPIPHIYKREGKWRLRMPLSSEITANVGVTPRQLYTWWYREFSNNDY